jgi:multidrug transporter EmrE-like cation transporter
MDIQQLSLYAFTGFITIIPLLFIEEYNSDNRNQPLFLIGALFCYVILIALYVKIFNQTNLSQGYSLIHIVATLAAVLIGVFYYKETLNTEQTIGIILMLISIYLLR